MKHKSPLATVGIAVCLTVLTACGASTTTSSSSAPASSTTAGQATTAESTPQASTPQVSQGQDSITVSGVGNGEVGPLTLDQPYYIVKTTNASAADYGVLTVTVKGKELPTITSLAPEYTRVFQPPSPSVTFTIECPGAYTLQFTKPPALSTAVPAPKSFEGAGGTTVTGLVSTKGTYVKLSLEYKGQADPNAATGIMLVDAQIYDAVTGDSILNVPRYVNKAKTEDSDGRTTQKPGAYFLIVSSRSDADTWEAKITED